MCPAYRVCMKQCLTVAGSIEQMLMNGTLPQLSEKETDVPVTHSDDEGKPPAGGPLGKGGLRVVK